jgi:PST family polysaccharide transporter
VQNNATKIGISGMFWMNIMALARYAVKIVTTYFLARLLTPADYGEITAISVLVGFAEIFWMMGIGPAIVQKKELTNDDIKTGNTINIILGVGIFACIFIFAGSLCNLFSISSAAMLRVYSIVFLNLLGLN